VRLELDAAQGVVRVEGRGDAALVERLLEKRTITSGCGKGTTFYHALDAWPSPRPGGLPHPPGPGGGADGEINRQAAVGRTAGASTTRPWRMPGDHGAAGGHRPAQRHRQDPRPLLPGGHPTGDRFLMSTGRISSEILIKAAKLGVPLLVSLSKPSELALELAGRLRITVVGDLRGRRGFIYRDFGHLS